MNKATLESILVNTCDKFEDCWDPFFKLFSVYWPDYQGRIYLNTEYKDYSFPGLDIVAVKGCARNNFPKDQRATWSQCLKWALDLIENDNIVLYMQEDYFLKDYVKDEEVIKLVEQMVANNDIDCIHLTDQAVETEEGSKYKNLDKVKLKQRYRLSCQAALWKKQTLLDHIRVYESAWEFEEFGSKRSAILNHNFYVISSEIVKLNTYEIVPYIFTGIVQGRWYEEVVPLFKKHNIQIDYSKRGFLREAKPRTIKQRIRTKINRIPLLIKHYKEIKRLKYNVKNENI